MHAYVQYLETRPNNPDFLFWNQDSHLEKNPLPSSISL